MPELCRFMGIVIKLYYDDHPPPHFHVLHAEGAARFLLDGTMLDGHLPPRKQKLVERWRHCTRTS